MNDPEDLERLAEDWIALWQSEIAGYAADPELAEQWAAWAALAAAWLRAATHAALPPRGFRPPPGWPPAGWGTGHDGAAPPPWPSAPAAPSGPGGTPRERGSDDASGRERDAMAARLAELERRLADVERGAGGSGPDRPGPRGRKPSP